MLKYVFVKNDTNTLQLFSYCLLLGMRSFILNTVQGYSQ